MRPINIAFGRSALDAISLLQDTVGAGNLLLNGTDVVVQDIYADLEADGHQTLFTRYADLQAGVNVAQYRVRLASANDNSGVDYTVLGLDANGNVISETLAGPTAVGEVFTDLSFAKVLQVSTDGAADQIIVGIDFVGASAAIPLDLYIAEFSVTIFVDPSSGGDVTVEYTGSDIFNKEELSNDQDAAWIAMSTLTNVTTNPTSGTLIEPVAAVRFVINTGTSSSISGRVIQAGVA